MKDDKKQVSEGEKPGVADDGKGRLNRRTLVKSAVLGGAASQMLPAQWAKPVVETVVLPAHAATSGAQFGGAQASAFGAPVVDKGDQSRSILDYFVEEAVAAPDTCEGFGPGSLPGSGTPVCIVDAGGTQTVYYDNGVGSGDITSGINVVGTNAIYAVKGTTASGVIVATAGSGKNKCFANASYSATPGACA